MNELFEGKLHVINVGLASFAEPIAPSGGEVTRLDWAPPGAGEPAVAAALARLTAQPALSAANARAFALYCAARPVLEGIGIARDVVPDMGGMRILHAGPPIAWNEMCGPMQGAVIGAILYEGGPPIAGPPAHSPSGSPWRRVTITPPSVRWPASSVRACRCGLSVTQTGPTGRSAT
jgi:hypothetical protein